MFAAEKILRIVPQGTHDWEKFIPPEDLQYIIDNGEGKQSRSQNTEKNTHIKGRLLEQAVILFNCVPFQNGNSS